MRDKRYRGEHGTENFLDDYFFGPLLLLCLVIFFTYFAYYGFENTGGDGKVGAIVGFCTGIILAGYIVYKELQYRREEE